MVFSRTHLLLALLAVQLPTWAAPGDLDATFGTSGRARITMPTNSWIQATTLQSDGKVVAVGRGNVVFAPVGSLMVMRLGVDGNPDPSFSGDGFAGTNALTFSQMTAVAVQVMPDNRILVAAQASGSSGLNFRTIPALARFMADGTPDTSFGPDGIRLLDFYPAGSSYVAAMVVLPDGHIVLGGNTDNGQGTGDYFFLRANADGTLDSTFGTSGWTRIDFGQTGDELVALTRMPDGKLLGIGQSVASGTSARIGVIRLLANGQLDVAGDGGKLRVQVATRDQVRSVTQQADGKVVIAGTADSPHSFDSDLGFVVRLSATGAIDTSFGSQGRIVRADPVFAVATQADGRVFFAGKERHLGFPEESGRGFVQAVLADGSADPDFAPAGRARIDFGSGSEWSRFTSFALLGMSDGRFVVLGNADQPTLLATRLRASGGHPGVLSLWRSDPQVSGNIVLPESQPSVEFTVERTGGSSGSVSVNYEASGPVAVAGRDFTATSGTLTWGDGETAAKRIVLPVLDDNDYEPANEVIDMTLSAPTGGALLGASQVSMQTTSDEYGVQLVIHDARVLESEGTAVVRVARTGDTRQPTTVDYRISDATAVAGVNYTATPTGTLSWNSGDVTDRFITLALIDNPNSQGGIVNVTLSNSNGGAGYLPDPDAIVDILDDDGPQGTQHAGRLFYYVSEGIGSVSVSLGRPLYGDPAQPMTLNLSTASVDPGITAGGDFGAPSITQLTWAVGDYSRRTINIPIVSDNRFEQTECFTLYDGLGGTLSIICILNDDPDPGLPGASFAQAEFHVSENVGTARLQVNRVGDSSRLTRVEITTGSSTLRSPEDYPGPPSDPYFYQVLAWQPDDTAPQFVEFPITNDTLPEPDEDIVLSLRNYPDPVAIAGSQKQARLVVDNDDGPFTPRVGFAQSAISVSEDAEYIDLPIMLTGTGADAWVSVALRSNSTADSGTEFVLPHEPSGFSFTDPFPPQFSQDVRVYLNGDNRSEADETFTLDLSGAPGLMPVGQSSITVTLLSNEVIVPPLPMQVGFAATSISQAENNTAVNLTVSRTGPITSALAVHYETQAGTALAGSDYTAATGDVAWAAGDGADKTITVNLINDSAVEIAETLSVRLTAPTNGATLSADTATITITSDDVAPPAGGGSSSGGGGGGGGRLDAALLWFALAMVCVAVAQRRRSSISRGSRPQRKTPP